MDNQEILKKISVEKENLNRIIQSEEKNKFDNLFKETHFKEIFIYHFDEALKATYDLCSCWYCENKNNDVFYQCENIEDMRIRYQQLRWFFQRIVYGMYDEKPEEIYKYIVEKRIGMSMITLMINTYIEQKEKLFFFIINLLRAMNEKKKVFQLLLYNVEYYPQNKEMHVQLAKLYLDAGKIDKALETLQKLKEPDDEIQLLMSKLKKMVD